MRGTAAVIQPDPGCFQKSTTMWSHLTRLPLGSLQRDYANAQYQFSIAGSLIGASAQQHIVSTTLYNDQFPGPLLRLKEGKVVTVDVWNDTDTPKLAH